MRTEWRLMMGCVVAVVLPASVLHAATSDARLAAGLTAAPFGWPRVLLGHFVAALPLGFLIARWLRTVPVVDEAARGLWIVCGFGVTGVAAVASSGFGEAVTGAAFESLLVLRTTLATGLVLPWCILATDPPPQVPKGRPGLWFALCAGLGLIPCGLYAEAVIESRTKTATEALATARLARAERELIGLSELGSDRPVLGKLPAELRPLVRKELDRLERTVQLPLPPHASRQARLARAGALIQLDRLTEAAEVLAPLAADTDAILLLAAIERDRENWATSDRYYEAALERLLPKASSDRTIAEMCRLCFEGLAYNARNEGRLADVERILCRGRDELVSDAAYFHFQLGQHYANTGRPVLAVEYLIRAAKHDPDRYHTEADQLIRRLRTATPACVHRHSY